MSEQETPELDPRTLAQIRDLQNRLENAIEDGRDRRKNVERLRQYVRGVQHTTNGVVDPEEVRANLVLGIIQTLLPLYYARDPEIEVSPEEQVEDASYGALDGFARTMQVVLGRLFIRDTKLKRRITRAVVSAMTGGVAWLKVSYQRDYWQDPVIANRIADAQDNLARIQSLSRQVEEDPAAHEAQAEELRQQIEALQQQVEVLVEEGLVIDFVNDDDIFILDDSLTTFSEYPLASAIAHRVWMTCEDYEDRYGKKPTGTKYADKREAAQGQSKRRASKQFVQVYEIWDRRAQTVYTMCLGAKEWSREPYRPERAGRRWYPLFALYWNEVDGQLYPLSDVEQWTGLQDEYNSMRTQLAQARRENRPGWAYRKGGAITDEDLQALANRGGRQFVGITTNGSQTPLNADLMPIPAVPIDAISYDATPILRDLEQTSGASDASRAAVQKVKTATEAEIQNQGMQSRTAYRRDTLEEFIGEMAAHAAQVLLLELEPAQVQRIAGAGAVWPVVSRADAYELISIRIRAGSTGKPNQHQEREAWVQLAPQLLQFIQQIAQFRQLGMNDQAEGLMALLRETLRRFDERLDLEQFFPRTQLMMPGAAPGIEMPPAGLPAGQALPPPNPNPGAGAPMQPPGA